MLVALLIHLKKLDGEYVVPLLVLYLLYLLASFSISFVNVIASFF